MCRTFEEIRNEGIAQGIEQGIEQERLESIRKLMKTLQLNAKQAMDALLIPSEEQPEYLAKLSA